MAGLSGAPGDSAGGALKARLDGAEATGFERDGAWIRARFGPAKGGEKEAVVRLPSRAAGAFSITDAKSGVSAEVALQ